LLAHSSGLLARASLLGAAQLVGSQLFVGSLENLTLFQSFHLWWNLVPIFNHSQADYDLFDKINPSRPEMDAKWNFKTLLYDTFFVFF
jgi:hypothetical protein